MRLALVVAAIFTLSILTACTTLQPAATTPAPADDAVTIRLPKWPYVVYSTEAQDAYVVLSIKDPKTFPIPKILTFTRQDGSKIEMKLMVKPEK